MQPRQIENTEVQKPKYETEVQKQKYVNEKKSYLLVSDALLTYRCVFRPYSQRVTVSKQCESQILASQAVASVANMMPW